MALKMPSNKKGQTSIEYLLLMAVVMGAVLLVTKSPYFKKFTANGDWIDGILQHLQFSYRHALPGKEIETYPPNYQQANHRSYLSSNNETRFFGPATEYP